MSLEIKEGVEIYDEILSTFKSDDYKHLLLKKWVSLDSVKEAFGLKDASELAVPSADIRDAIVSGVKRK